MPARARPVRQTDFAVDFMVALRPPNNGFRVCLLSRFVFAQPQRSQRDVGETVRFDHLLQLYLSSLSSIQCGEKRETILRVLSEGNG